MSSHRPSPIPQSVIPSKARNLLFPRIAKTSNRCISHIFSAALLMCGCVFVSGAAAQSPEQSTFNTPEEAVKALVAAATDEDQPAMQKLFGPEYNKLLSGDPVEDKKDMDGFAAAIQQSAQLLQVDATKYTVTAGQDAWPTPIPLVQKDGQKDGKWFFDTQAGLEEILDRRIGENELSAIETCRAYAVAQWEYYTQGDWDHDGLAEYAQRLVSTPGKHDGLYWETGEGENPSPLGALVAAARAAGYGPKQVTLGATGKSGAVPDAPDTAGKGGTAEDAPEMPRAPYHGYYFKILTRQGPHAPGGKFSYVINGNMIAGYALAAYPDRWSNSGVMTFIVNQQGRVYEKNLGPATAKLAATMTEYDPDATWHLVGSEP